MTKIDIYESYELGKVSIQIGQKIVYIINNQ